MARKRTRGRSVNGVFLLDKPFGLSSNHALQRVRRLFDANKAGHTGSLDPLATGVLPICLGEATKFSQFLLDAEKGYRSTFSLGLRTESGDVDGGEVSRIDASNITLAQIEQAVETFGGDIQQVPSMYSALKHNGQPLYKLARQGIEVERAPRSITIYDYKILDFRPGVIAELDVEVRCSKGTYIRSLADDLGQMLGCGAHVSALHRTLAGPFHESETLTLSALEEMRESGEPEQLDHLLKPMDIAVADRMAVELSETVAAYFQLGQEVMSGEAFRNGQEGDIVRVFREGGAFLGVATVTEDGRIAPKRLVVET
ncbi:tRNA pseudouridine synthase B [marine gamma proteobacterium HTCC2207]|uniref:tRNA pseudouridine synthase B n=1 Tax=gamma proteobacterium HTCC2207 TaxID=314287 RepID=Q1YSY0_9GAMM|nr:tRNA pseudouridine synthase B [marine gamma proteobacterium HTCC2207] [gamma proteobacterium HTCC2207]MDB4428291.1 tRNA pseudouridine(55) synthase TruB [Porticoccaceae bacterium]MDC0588187.1 tRNA pseudouridine(55) synthase TruB [Porticoccaceae bacterium]MDG1079222.1 tRNA pseudouridine(55) synthase TruB [Porticoccaceae bacterium]